MERGGGGGGGGVVVMYISLIIQGADTLYIYTTHGFTTTLMDKTVNHMRYFQITLLYLKIRVMLKIHFKNTTSLLSFI